MHAIIEPTATDLYCHLDGAPDELRLDSADALGRLQAWTCLLYTSPSPRD